MRLKKHCQLCDAYVSNVYRTPNIAPEGDSNGVRGSGGKLERSERTCITDSLTTSFRSAAESSP